MKVLIVEDQPIELKLALQVLSAAGHDVSRAASAEVALAMIRDDRPELILLDLALPGIDGLTFARLLKSDETTRGIRLVAVTSYPEEFTLREVLDAGCDAYLAKPLSTRTLPEILAQVIHDAGERPVP
jgi:two-component system cell cycle response regulator